MHITVDNQIVQKTFVLDPLGNIMSAMTVHRSKQRVIEKLLGLGLVNDRSELYKKRGKKSKKDDYDSDSGDGYEEDGGFVVSQRNVDTSGMFQYKNKYTSLSYFRNKHQVKFHSTQPIVVCLKFGFFF